MLDYDFERESIIGAIAKLCAYEKNIFFTFHPAEYTMRRPCSLGAVDRAHWLAVRPVGWRGNGQRPSEDVQQLQRREDIETFFLSGTPATVNGGKLVACPLARLRDGSQEGVHTHHSNGVKESVSVSEYIYADYPFLPFQRLIQGFAGGSWLCVYFDDYLTLTGTGHYPTGYVRYTTTEERRMLNRMTEDYDIDPVYVLDMYQHGKVSWMIDFLFRLIVCLAAAGIAWSMKNAISKRIFPTGGE